MTANGKRLLMWTAAALLVAVALALAFTPRPVSVDLVTAAKEPMVVTVDEEGETRVHDVFTLSAPVAGRIRRIEAHAGDAVEANETVLAQIEPGDPTFLDPRGEAQALAAIQAADAARALAAAAVDEAAAEFEFARTELSRAQELIADGTISQRDLDAAQRTHKTTRAELATARAALQMRKFELEQARAQLVSPTQTQARHGTCKCVPITSPVSGRVLTVIDQSERVIGAGEAIMQIGDPANLEIVVDFLSADAVRIQPAQKVIIDNWGGVQSLTGRVQRVEPFGFTKTSALGIEEQRVNVVIDFVSSPEQWQRLGHGYQVEARVVLWQADNVLTVPLTALFRQEGEWALFVEQDGRAALRAVKVGQRNGLAAEITAGLEAGERVIVHPSDRVVAGVKIAARG
jgi:HlyD family secretion protein